MRQVWAHFIGRSPQVLLDMPGKCLLPCKTMRDPALVRAIEEAGGVAELARKLSISSQAVSQWDRVPAERALEVERATGGAVTRHDLRPDLYPVEQDAA
jgi:hypothetical protein